MREPGCKLPAHSVAAQAARHPGKQCMPSPVRPKLWAMLFLVDQCKASTPLLHGRRSGVQAVADSHLESTQHMQCTGSQAPATEVQQRSAPTFRSFIAGWSVLPSGQQNKNAAIALRSSPRPILREAGGEAAEGRTGCAFACLKSAGPPSSRLQSPQLLF